MKPLNSTLDNGSSNCEETATEMRPSDDGDDGHGVAGGGGQSNINIKVSFGSNQLDLAVPSDSTFGDLKRIISQEIGLDSKAQKLLFRGIEKDDHDYLHVAGVKNNSKILLMEEAPANDEIPEEVEAPANDEIPEEVEVPVEISLGGEAVAKVRAEVDTLSEQVSALEAVVGSGTKVDEKDIIYLTEMLMRQLLKLDGIEAQGEGRVQRKTEVRRVQSLVEKVDILKTRNSNPISNTNNAASVTPQWETFESGVGSLNPPSPLPASTEVTQNWEQF